MKILLNTLTLLIFAITTTIATAQTVTYRFVYASADCSTDEVCFDVEAQGDEANLELDEFNMRMFIDDSSLTFIDFRNPDPLYYLETGGNTQTGVSGSGSFFGFTGDFVYITDNYKRTGASGMTLETGSNWSYLFQACFNSADPLAGMNMMCPPLVWDHDTDGSGFASGSDGIESLLVNPAGGAGISVDEAVIFFNWDYNAPIQTDCFDPNCTVLAADILSFTAETSDCKLAMINWEVAQETGVSKYILERKLTNESSFTAIEEIEALGLTFEAVTYTTTDAISQVNGLVIYRIVEVMEDGTENYLSITEMNKPCGSDIEMNVYPNPTADYVNISFAINQDDTEVSVQMVDMSGRVVNERLVSGSYSEGSHESYIDLTNTPTGQYIIHAKIGNNIETKMVSIIKE